MKWNESGGKKVITNKNDTQMDHINVHNEVFIILFSYVSIYCSLYNVRSIV